MKNNWLYIVLILGLLSLAVMLWDSSPEKLIFPDEPVPPALTPYAIIDGAHSRHYGAQGELSYEFVAQTLRHFRIDLSHISPDDYTTMSQPQLTLYTDELPWFVTAERGRIADQGDTLTLWQSVRIWQELEDGQMTELTTDRLVIQPKDKQVHTQSEVTIRSAQGRINAEGMTVDLNTKTIQLLSKVRGYHEPI